MRIRQNLGRLQGTSECVKTFHDLIILSFKLIKEDEHIYTTTIKNFKFCFFLHGRSRLSVTLTSL
ncbi:hypothetical protein BpHYR1_025301 [Brachionus plicatilis]|uniref:Uncharacterized protein n=1 Tax=Brachionus plicatilis TaxID=10195 RepID=A0A3M7QHP9_BRAPC|nr:hypothetical protein BpHYR1_025301 [Brachionus plicatilis]